ncbi:hypothetical protein AAG570_009036 [Ranatra chinensis]|uniref:Protein argonaute N-terminal domain-containing protein n=1 Tax=Ranatra chinensis TaxID=642074 RepID=A0ABD0YSN1_9HEMI
MEHYRHIEYPNKFPAFDGKKNLYSVDRLRDSITCFNVFDDERGKEIEYTVEVKYASTVDMSSLNHYMERGTSLSTPMEALQAIDIALRNPSALRRKFQQPK